MPCPCVCTGESVRIETKDRSRHETTSRLRILIDTEACAVFICVWTRQVFRESELQAARPGGQVVSALCSLPLVCCVGEVIYLQCFPTFSTLWHTFYVTKMLNCETWACFDKLDVLKCVSNWWQAHAELMVNCLGKLKWSSSPYKTILAWTCIFHDIPGQLWRHSRVLWHTGWKSLPQTSECASVCGRQCWSAASKVSLSASARTITAEFPQ